MYDFEDLVAANDALWAAIRDGLRAKGVEAPEELTRGSDLWDIWQSPALLLAQTCGYPFRARLHPKVKLVGAFDYGVSGCAPGAYCSYFIARQDDARVTLTAFNGVALAYNEALSQSGWAAPQNHAASVGLRFPAGLKTGAHRLTAYAIAQGRADLGAVDAVTWRHLQRVDPVVQGLRMVAQTAPTPGLPLITAQAAMVPLLWDTITQAINQLPAATLAILGLRGLVAIAPNAYLDVPNPAPPSSFSP